MFYVYLHKRESDGKVFYVGKGHGKRAWRLTQRGEWWNRVREKHGVTVELFQEGLTEEAAYLLEINLIKALRESGEPLVNINTGGKGAECRPVYRCDGTFYESIASAALSLSAELGRRVTSGHISSCATGNLNSAYGYNWSYFGVPGRHKSRKELLRDSLGVTIYCSNGEKFKSIAEAVEWLRNNTGVAATGGDISTVAGGDGTKTAYGFNWSYTSYPRVPVSNEDRCSKLYGKKVIRSDGLVFNSISEAARVLTAETGTLKYRNYISRAVDKNLKRYGFYWESVKLDH